MSSKKYLQLIEALSHTIIEDTEQLNILKQKIEEIEKKYKEEHKWGFIGVYDMKNKEQLVRLGSIFEIIKFLSIPARSFDRASKKRWKS